jgi:hypothetical protein
VPAEVAACGPGLGPSACVASLHVEAVVANWDEDAEPDGLRVLVVALDRLGQPVPVPGQVDFELVGGVAQVADDGQIVGGPSLAAEFGRWGRRLPEGPCDAEPAVFDLPFQSVHPHRDPRVDPVGELLVRLGIPGRGTFEATTDVLLYPY